MAKYPLISIIIPVIEHTYYLIFENLPAMDTQTFKSFEVILLPCEHGQYDLTLLKQYKWLRIIPTGKDITRPALKRDIGAKAAKGKILAFIDDDAYPAPAWLEQAAKFFKNKRLTAVCGPGILPEKTNIWEKIFDSVLKTWIGAGGYRYRFVPGKKRYVTDFPSMNFFIKKDVFLKLGGFNSDYWPGEDSKLCNDIIEKEKGKIVYSPQVVVHHHRRNNLKGYLKQHGNYGFHRGAFFAHGDKNSRDVAYLIPTFFVIYIIALILYLILALIFHLLTSWLTLLVIFPFLIYCLFIMYLLLKSFVDTKNILIGLGAPVTLVLTHIIYGTQFIKGFNRGLDKTANIYDKK